MGRTRAEPRTSQRQQAPPSDAQIAALIAAIVGGGVATAAPLAAVAFVLVPVVAPFGLPAAEAAEVAEGAARLVVEGAPEPPGAPGMQDPLGRMHIRNLLRRAQYAIKAARRVAAAVRQGKSVRDAFAQEGKNFRAHRQNEKGRVASAEAARAHIGRYGIEGTWIHGDPKEPRPHHLAADGGQFDVTSPPATVGGVLPGELPNCTCTIGAPRSGARRLT